MIVGLVATALGASIPWPLWAVLAGNAIMFGSDAIREKHPTVSGALVLAGGLSSVAAVVALVATHR